MQETFSPSTIEKIKAESAAFSYLSREIGKVVVGNQEPIKLMTIAILCNGHILLEGVPGVAKTTMIKAITQTLGLSFKRIQFTPDLLPADLIGTLIYNPKTQSFETKKGPIFANLILADEINRAPAKVQAALLEAMQEQQVTIGSQTFKLDEPFLVFATQNPIEQEGTYNLPEAQVDRFMFKVLITYPTEQQEREIIQQMMANNAIQQVLDKATIVQAQELINTIYIDEKIINYLLSIVFATRTPAQYNVKELKNLIACGVSPRATLALHHAARAHAFLNERHFVTPDDVKAVCWPIMRHRLTLTYEAQADAISTDEVIQKILSRIAAP